MSLKGKTLLIVGGSGYVGSATARHAAKLGINTVCVSRKGEPSTAGSSYGSIRWVKGDSMRPKEFREELKQADGVIHTIGTLIDTTVTSNKRPGDVGTYEQMNFETAKRVGDELNDINMNKKIVYLSADAHPPMLKRYLSTKLDAEEYLRSLPHIRATALRPGFIWSKDARPWSLPLKSFLSLENSIYQKVNNFLPESKAKETLKCLYPGYPVNLDDVALAAIYNAFSPEFDGRALGTQQIEACSKLFQRNSFNI